MSPVGLFVIGILGLLAAWIALVVIIHTPVRRDKDEAFEPPICAACHTGDCSNCDHFQVKS